MSKVKLATGLSILLILVAVSLAYMIHLRQRSVSMAQRNEAVEREVISVFYPADGGRLRRKVEEVQRQPTEKARAGVIFRALKEARCIPDRLRLNELAFGKDGVLYLDVSKEFLDRSAPLKEITMTYGIVNSFIESFRDVKSVQLLVEGQPVYTKGGLLYILKPLQFNKDLLEE